MPHTLATLRGSAPPPGWEWLSKADGRRSQIALGG